MKIHEGRATIPIYKRAFPKYSENEWRFYYRANIPSHPSDKLVVALYQKYYYWYFYNKEFHASTEYPKKSDLCKSVVLKNIYKLSEEQQLISLKGFSKKTIKKFIVRIDVLISYCYDAINNQKVGLRNSSVGSVFLRQKIKCLFDWKSKLNELLVTFPELKDQQRSEFLKQFFLHFHLFKKTTCNL